MATYFGPSAGAARLLSVTCARCAPIGIGRIHRMEWSLSLDEAMTDLQGLAGFKGA
jgi:hypothetical protein